MPLKLCKSEQKRLDELLDRVEKLSNIVDELTAEVNAIKIYVITASNENLTERSDRSEAGTLHKLKKCLKKSLSPVLSMGRTCGVWKKCQRIFSQSPTTTSRPANLPENKHQNVSSTSHAEANTCSLTSENSPPPCLDATEAKGQERQKQLPSQHRKKITKDFQKAESLENSSSSFKRSENSLNKSYQSHNPHCRYETSNSWNLSQFDDPGKLEKKITKKKTRGTNTSASVSPIKVASHKKRNVDTETVKQQQSVSFKEGQKKTPLEKSSSISTVLPGTNISGHRFQDWSVTSAKPKSDFNVKRKNKGTAITPEKKKKRSISVQCSIDCQYQNTLPSRQKDVCIGTLCRNLRRKNKDVKIKNLRKVRKLLKNEETQTYLKMNKCSQSIYLFRRRNCLGAKRRCFSAGSQSSLTCSVNSFSSFYPRTEDLGEDSTHIYCERGPTSAAENFEKKRNAKALKKRNARTRRKRRNRTYTLPFDTPIRKSDETDEYKFNDQEDNSSSIGDTAFQGKILKQRKRRKKWKKPAVLPKVGGGHQCWNNQQQQSSLKKDNNYMLTSVCTNRQTEWLGPKLERFSNWTPQKRQMVPCKLANFRESASSSSFAYNNETCSLASDPSLSRSDGSITFDRFDREEKGHTKDFTAFSRQ